MPTPDTPAAREAQKTQDQRAEDIAYTINHALACTATDALEPYLDHWFQKKLGFHFPLGCGHDHHGHHDHHQHDHHHHCDHHHPPQKNHLLHWYVGEIAGDFGAVPITVGMQRLFPGLMHGISKALEPALGPLFRLGASHSAKQWAKREGYAADSSECKAREQAIYRHEVDHLSQALLWTASSVSLNLATQKLMGNDGKLWQLGAAKAMGAGLNTLVVVGARAALPVTARNWDQFTSKHLFLPATKAIGHWIGIDAATVDRMAEKHAQEDSSWATRVKGSDTSMREIG